MQITRTLVAGTAGLALVLSGCGTTEPGEPKVIEVTEEGLDFEDGVCQYDVEYSNGDEVEQEVPMEECVEAGVVEEDSSGGFALVKGKRHAKGSAGLAAHGTSTAPKPTKPSIVQKIKAKASKPKTKKRK